MNDFFAVISAADAAIAVSRPGQSGDRPTRCRLWSSVFQSTVAGFSIKEQENR